MQFIVILFFFLSNQCIKPEQCGYLEMTYMHVGACSQVWTALQLVLWWLSGLPTSEWTSNAWVITASSFLGKPYMQCETILCICCCLRYHGSASQHAVMSVGCRMYKPATSVVFARNFALCRAFYEQTWWRMHHATFIVHLYGFTNVFKASGL